MPGWAGLSPRGRTIVTGAARGFLSLVDGTSDFRPLRRYVLPDGRIVREVRQQTSWVRGPVWFLTLVDEHGAAVPGADWTADEIADYLAPAREPVPA